jgi:hypothetical protein
MAFFADRASGRGWVRKQMAVLDFRVACGEFISVSDLDRHELERSGTALVPPGIPYSEEMFAARARGGSMEPPISNGAWCLFHLKNGGTRQDRIVLVEDQSKPGIERYTLKRYHSRIVDFPDGSWSHEEILLFPLNRSYSPIRLQADGIYRVCGWFVGSVPELEQFEPLQYYLVGEE